MPRRPEELAAAEGPSRPTCIERIAMNNRIFFLLSLAVAVSLLIAACVSPSGTNVDMGNLNTAGNGGVQVSCTAPQVACGGVCVSLDSNPNNCGACGLKCGPGKRCVAAVCVAR